MAGRASRRIRQDLFGANGPRHTSNPCRGRLRVDRHFLQFRREPRCGPTPNRAERSLWSPGTRSSSQPASPGLEEFHSRRPDGASWNRYLGRQPRSYRFVCELRGLLRPRNLANDSCTRRARTRLPMRFGNGRIGDNRPASRAYSLVQFARGRPGRLDKRSSCRSR